MAHTTAAQAAAEVFDSYFIQETSKGDKGQVVAATVRTARSIVLTQDSSAPVGKAVVVSESGDLTVFGETVRVAGNVKAPGRKVKIVCRRLEFFPDDDGRSSLSVAGTAGVKDAKPPVVAKGGENGLETRRAGQAGEAGANGENGKDGSGGGSLEVYCDVLFIGAVAELSAEGGHGADGAAGQPGGNGGHGWDGYDIGRAGESVGGEGGCGGNGGDGGMGGPGGRVTLWFQKMERQNDKCTLTVSALGGAGGTGGNPGAGGKGGDGGKAGDSNSNKLVINDWLQHKAQFGQAMMGASGADGGVCGAPGNGGNGGPAGAVSLGLPLGVKAGSDTKEFSSFSWGDLYAFTGQSDLGRLIGAGDAAFRVGFPTSSHPRQGPDGTAFAKDVEYSAPGEFAIVAESGGGSFAAMMAQMGLLKKRPSDPNQRRKTSKGARPALGSADLPKKIEHKQIGYKELASQTDANAMEMIFDQVRLRFLMTPLDADAAGLAPLISTTEWLAQLADGGGNAAMFTAASGTLQNLRLGFNIFGKNAKFAALGSIDNCKGDLEAMINLYRPVEADYEKFSNSLKEANEQRQYLQNIDAAQGSLSHGLLELRDENLKQLKEALGQINTLETARIHLADILKEEIEKLKVNIQQAFGLSVQDFINLFSQLSFTNTEQGPQGLAMIGSQLADMVTKAMDNVPSDTGAPLNKKFVIRKMEALDKDVKNIAALKKRRDGLLQADPQAEYRLLSTREQLNSILSNFYDQFPVAKQIGDTFDGYMEAVDTRNSAVEDYNQALGDFAYIQSELQKLKDQCAETQALLQSSAQPGLTAIAKFSNALRRSARERCIEQLYLACRVYTIQSLDLYDVFGDVLGKLNAGGGDLNAAALDTALIDLISRNLADYQKKRTSRSTYQPEGDHCTVTLTPKKNALLFQSLHAGKPGIFQMLAANPTTTIERNAFAGMADVRVTHIRCNAVGIKTSDGVQHIEITHSGVETFYTEDGKAVQLNHNPMTHVSRYNTRDHVYQDGGKLDEAHNMIGPFCQWTLCIPKEINGADLDLNGLESISVEFEGSYRPFVRTHAN